MQGAVLNKEEIREKILKENLIESYIDLEKQLQPNGFDCTLKKIFKLIESGKIDFSNEERLIPRVKEIKFNNDWVFLPRGLYRVRINEIINLGKNLTAIARPRSSLVRSGANVLTAVWDAGYKGRSEVGLVVYNESGIWLKKNARIMQLIFIKLTGKTEPYKGIFYEENI